MVKEVKTALRRSDSALLGALAIAFAGMLPVIALNLYSDANAAAMERPIVVTQSAVEQAAVNLTAETGCLAEALYYEGRGEGLEGQKAIAEVILQRTHDSAFPTTICGVVHEGADQRTGCQFSYTCDGSMREPRNLVSWRRMRLLADAIVAGTVRLGDETDHALYFHNTDVAPPWADTMLRTTQIGNHVFYKRDTHRTS